MLLEGLKLMGVGMATVMLFLGLMITCIVLVTRLTRAHTALEEQALRAKHQPRAQSPAPSQSEDALPMAVLAAAVAVYEDERKSFSSTT